MLIQSRTPCSMYLYFASINSIWKPKAQECALKKQVGFITNFNILSTHLDFHTKYIDHIQHLFSKFSHLLLYTYSPNFKLLYLQYITNNLWLPSIIEYVNLPWMWSIYRAAISLMETDSPSNSYQMPIALHVVIGLSVSLILVYNVGIISDLHRSCLCCYKISMTSNIWLQNIWVIKYEIQQILT